MFHAGRFLTPVLTLALLSSVPLRAVASGPPPATPSASVPPPAGFTVVTSADRTLAEGGWTNTSAVTIHVQTPNSTPGLAAQIELEPAGTPFTGEANYTGTESSASGVSTVSVTGLSNGTTYHWQVRLQDAGGNSGSWTVPSAGGAKFDFGVDQTAPTRPVITSPTAPNQSAWYKAHIITVSWTAHDSLSGIAGYSYVVERQAHVIPPGALERAATLRLPNLGNGVWFLAVRAEDGAGNWSPTATYRLQIDRIPPHIHWLNPPGGTFNPYKGPITVKFSFDKTASGLIRLYRVGSRREVATYSFHLLPAGRVAAITWSGMTGKNRYVPKGYYFFSVDATDRADNVFRANVGGMSVDPARPGVTLAGIKLYPDDGKRVIVSLSQQRFWATQGDRVVITSLVTTGNPQLPTPLGTYHIMEKLHPFEFISPWPEGSPYYYAPSWSSYAMLFRDGGYFLHDAPWRSVFGPGSNGAGQPGTNYGGTHGCVNMPLDAAHFLFDWAPVGTEVDVVP